MKLSLKKLLISLFISITAITTANAAVMQATVLSAKGKTEVQKGTGWVPLKAGSVLNKGDVIQTGFKSELILKIKNTTVTVAPLSRITIEQLAEKGNKDDTRLFLDTGSLKSDVKKTEDRRVGFTVRSPVATASVRGTVIGVANKFGNVTAVYGFDGVTAAWKNEKTAVPEIVADEPDAPEVTGNNASAVSDGLSGAGAVLVRKDMQAGYGNKYGAAQTTSPQVNAVSKVSDIGGTKSPSAVPASPVSVEPATTPAPTTGGKSSLKVNIEFAD